MSGFDRLVLRGAPRRLNISYYDSARNIVVAKGMEEFLWQNGIRFKRYDYVKRTSERVKKAATKLYQDAGLPVIYLRQADADKDACARRVAAERGITSGPVCVLSALEPCPTFDYVQSNMARRKRPCHVLYQYRLDEQFGWMSRPHSDLVSLPHPDWMERTGMVGAADERPRIEVPPERQLQLATNWVEALNAFARQLNPLHQEIFAQYPTEYY